MSSCHHLDNMVELSILFESNQFVASSLECDRGTHLRYKDFLIKMLFLKCFFVLHGVSIDFNAHFSLFSGNRRLESLEDKLSSPAYFTLIWIYKQYMHL